MNDSKGVVSKFVNYVALSRRRALEGHLSLPRQLVEMTVLALTRRMGPGYYHTAGYWRPEVPWTLKTGQLDPGSYRKLLARLNPAPYRKITQHKVAEKAVLKLFSIPTPDFVGLLCANGGLDREGRPLRNHADLAQLLTTEPLPGIVFKAVEGHGGKQVKPLLLQMSPPITCHPPGHPEKRAPLEQFIAANLSLETSAAWLVERYFEQHATMRAINPTSVNTVRAWVLRRGEGDPEVVTAYLRIGRGGMTVDNASSGGIVAPIVLDKGQLRAAQDATAQRGQYARHPDHGAAIEGVCIPFWMEVQQIAKKALSVFPHMRFAGLDVAIGPNGPVVIELNVQPDREGAAFTGYASADLDLGRATNVRDGVPRH
jgi:hypothetical protein